MAVKLMIGCCALSNADEVTALLADRAVFLAHGQVNLNPWSK